MWKERYREESSTVEEAEEFTDSVINFGSEKSLSKATQSVKNSARSTPVKNASQLPKSLS